MSPVRVSPGLGDVILVTTDQNTVLILNEDGTFLTEFGSEGTGCGEFNCCRGICCNSRGEILIVDRNNYRIQIFSHDGRFLHTFGSKGDGPYELNLPRGICVDQEDNIYIADQFNNRVSIFDPDWLFIRQILIDRPLDLCLIGKDIVVTSGNGFIKIFTN